jgi:thermostable 8-oxoguanine DNA glycosylase
MKIVYNLSRQNLRFPEDRFTPFYKYSNKYKGGLTSLAQDILDNPRELREEITSNVKFMGLKTTSFWYLCLGGKELMTLDVHNLRQISNLDIIPIKESHYLHSLLHYFGGKELKLKEELIHTKLIYLKIH